MGEIVTVAYVVLALVGLALLAIGLARRARRMIVSGSALLLALGGAWTLGPVGAVAGLLALLIPRRGPAAPTHAGGGPPGEPPRG